MKHKHTHLQMLAYKPQTWVDKPIKQVTDNGLVHFSQCTGEGIQPGLDQRPPAQCSWFHVDHATTGYLYKYPAHYQNLTYKYTHYYHEILMISHSLFLPQSLL